MEDISLSQKGPLIRIIEVGLELWIRSRCKSIDSINIGNEKEQLSIDVVVDRLKVKKENRQRLAESLETAIKKGSGRAIVINTNNKETQNFSSKFRVCCSRNNISKLSSKQETRPSSMGSG